MVKKKNSHLWDRHPEDFYVEPHWCSRRLFQSETFEGMIHDPACGRGRILAEAVKSGYPAYGSDLVARGGAGGVRNFLDSSVMYDNIVCNPPFGLCSKHPYPFVAHAILHTRRKLALLLPLVWAGGAKRSVFLRETPLSKILVLAPRPSMPPGPVIEAGIAPGGGKKDYAWFIWDKVGLPESPRFGWLVRDER